jgi:hypothetical protein
MSRKQFFLIPLAVLTITAMVFNACKKDDEPKDLTLETLVAGTIDLNAAVSAGNVPLDPTIVATFSTDIDPTTATAANIELISNYDNVNIPLTITVSGKTITLVPTVTLGTGTLFDLKFKAGLKSTEGKFLAEVSRNFTTEGSFAPAGVIAHWTFEDNANDVAGDFNPPANGIVDITYVASRNAAAGKAASFNGASSIIEIPMGDVLMNTSDFTINFWVKTNSADKTTGHFVMGLAGWYGFQFEVFGGYDGAKFAHRYEVADGSTVSEDMWFPALADLGWQGWTFAKSLTVNEMMALLKDSWLHVTFTYNAATRVATLYYNSEKMKSFDFNLWPDGDPQRNIVGLKYDGDPNGNKLALGFIQARDNRTIADEWADPSIPTNNHFKGLLDDIRIYHKVLSETEIQLMYNSEKP